MEFYFPGPRDILPSRGRDPESLPCLLRLRITFPRELYHCFSKKKCGAAVAYKFDSPAMYNNGKVRSQSARTLTAGAAVVSQDLPSFMVHWALLTITGLGERPGTI